MSRGASENRFCTVQARTWDDGDFTSLSAPIPNAQTLWLYLLCGPYTTRVPGVISGGRAAMAEALGWQQEDFDRCFAEIESRGMAIADWRHRIVYLPKSFQQSSNRPHVPTVCSTWRKVIADLPECPLLEKIDAELRQMLATIGNAFLATYEGVQVNGDTREPSNSPAKDPTKDPTNAHTRGRARGGTGTGTDQGSGLPGKTDRVGDGLIKQVAAALAENGITMPPVGSVGELANLFRDYATATGKEALPLPSLAIEAFKRIAATWQVPKPPLPHLLIKHWDEIQTVIGGHKPESVRASPSRGGALPVEHHPPGDVKI